ncbi:MAG: hypothetical protein QOF51_1958 [Chloroflexota bacterium]|jgi:sugar/nucleoside kinase (ribokinase family)|nr:hypothetical protein [Chloroflexota bacterium]
MTQSQHIQPDYVLIGHVTRDRSRDGERPGGTVLYAAVAAARLGRRVGIVTACEPDFGLPSTLAGVAVHRVPSNRTTTFMLTHDAQGQRELRLEARARTLTADDVPLAWRNAPIIHLGPVVWEIDAEELTSAFGPSQLVATVQGWLRTVNSAHRNAARSVLASLDTKGVADSPESLAEPSGLVQPDPAALGRLPLGRFGAAVLSIEDVGGDEALIEEAAHNAPLLVVTRGASGCTLYTHDAREDVRACPARAVDTVGAGDVFATALFVRLAETSDAAEAARFAACAAALAVERPGWESIPDRAQVLARREALGT